ncbi:MAG: LacI family DNA-binding transcriptional regulator [Verrucomicrobiota bacterium]|nr:LacI family DNA-binding transcriptional regulator [Verrucomicrobiota bacterium]
MAVRLKDIAEEVGYSVNTVSKALSGKGQEAGIATKTCNFIIARAKKMGYRPNLFARSLGGGQSNIIGLLVSQIDDDFYVPIIYQLERVLMDKGFIPFLGFLSSEEEENVQSISMLLQLNIRAVVLIGDKGEISSPVIADIWPKNIPVLAVGALGKQRKDIYTLPIDYYSGGYQAVEHLIKTGHREIAFVESFAKNKENSEKQKGWMAAIGNYGVQLDDQLLFACEEENLFESSAEVVDYLLMLPSLPSAVVCFNDMVAFGIIRALRKNGLSVPNDISIMGFRDSPAAENYNPALSTIRIPAELISENVVEFIKNPDKFRSANNKTVTPQLMIRESTEIEKL